MVVQASGSESLGNQVLRNAPVYDRVEVIRAKLMKMDYPRVQDIERLRSCYETGVVANMHEGLVRTDEEIALDEMMIEMRVPIGEITMQCRKDYIAFILEDGGVNAQA